MGKHELIRAIKQKRIISDNMKDQKLLFLVGRDAGFREAISMIEKIKEENETNI